MCYQVSEYNVEYYLFSLTRPPCDKRSTRAYTPISVTWITTSGTKTNIYPLLIFT